MSKAHLNALRAIAILSCVALPLCAADQPARKAPAVAPKSASGKIEFSDRSDQALVPKSTFNAEEVDGPVRSRATDVAAPPLAPPQATGAPYDAKKVQDLLDREKNWIFNKPEDFGKDQSVEEVLGVDSIGGPEKEEYSSRFERFLKEGPEQPGRLGNSRDRERDRERDSSPEDNENGLGEDFSLRFLLNQEKADNTAIVEAAGDKRQNGILGRPGEQLRVNSPLARGIERPDADATRFQQIRPLDVNKLITDPTRGPADSQNALKDGGRQAFTPTFGGGPTKDMDRILESTRETLAPPVNARAGGLESLGGGAFNAGAAKSIATPPPVQEARRPEHKPAVLPIPRRTF
ncbi:MAG TPA: hypothetical protein VEH27_20125 [Methylomirabilota bacterium]|nr:hypothetical protein [Methylomirabilota bacterium]